MATEIIEGIKEILITSIKRLDDVAESRQKHIEDKFKDTDIKYQIQFSAAKEALGIALVAQEKSTAQALDGTKEAIIKNDANTDKRFDLLSEKIDSIAVTMNKNTGAAGIYVTHSDLSMALDKLQTNIEIVLRPVVTFMNANQGGKEEVKNVWGYVLGAIGATSTIILLLMKFIQ